MELYDNYLRYFDKTPEEQYREDMQQFVIDSWEDNVLLDDIILEDNPRTFIYDNEDKREVIIDSVSEVSTNYVKIEGNYISVLFKDCSFQYDRGSLFYRPSNKCYYLVYQGTNYMRTTSKCKAIQCNNILKWIDVQTKQIIAYPCTVGQDLSSTTSQDLKFISTANGRNTTIVMGNEYTRRLELNQRLIFNGVPYRINAIKNYEENNFEDRDVNLLFLYLEKVSIEPTDDYVYNIANIKEYEYNVTLNQSEIKSMKDSTGTLTATLTCNNEVVDGVRFKWFSDNEDVVTIDKNGNYVVVGQVGDTAKIKCLYIDNIYAEIEVEVVDTIPQNIELKISPNDEYIEIPKNDYQIINAYLYIDNVKVDNPNITYQYNGAVGYYNVIDVEEGIKIICNNACSQKLIITISDNDYNLSKEITVKLKGLW